MMLCEASEVHAQGRAKVRSPHGMADSFPMIEQRKVMLVQHEAVGTISVDLFTSNT